jgi:DnaJ-class molecular chaperone
MDSPSPRKCTLCGGKGGSKDVPCVPCGGSGWRMVKPALTEEIPARDDLHDEIPF